MGLFIQGTTKITENSGRVDGGAVPDLQLNTSSTNSIANKPVAEAFAQVASELSGKFNLNTSANTYTDFNSLPGNGLYILQGTSISNAPYTQPSAYWWECLQLGNGGRIVQITGTAYLNLQGSEELWYRNKHDSTWSSWKRLANTNDLATKLNKAGDTMTGPLALNTTGSRIEVDMRTANYSGFFHVNDAEIAMSLFSGGNFEQQLNFLAVRATHTELSSLLNVPAINVTVGWMDWWYNSVNKGSIFANTSDADFYVRANVAGGNLHLNCANNVRLESDAGTLVLGRNGTWQNIAANAFNVQSSRKVKENIADMTENDAKKILDIAVVSFDYIKEIGGVKNQYGVIAEDVEDVIPSVVTIPKDYDENSDDYMNTPSVDYSKFVPFLIKMVQMQQKQIAELSVKVEELENVINSN